MIPTVRVAHPMLGFITINAADFDPARHELLGVQGEGFDPASARISADPMDPALRDAAAALCLRMLAFKRRVAGEPFAEMSAADKLAILAGMEAELSEAQAAYEDDQREREVFEARERDRAASEAAQAAQEAARAASGEDAPLAPLPPAGEPLRVGKGPRGLWFVFRGEERVSKGYPTEGEATTAMGRGVA